MKYFVSFVTKRTNHTYNIGDEPITREFENVTLNNIHPIDWQKAHNESQPKETFNTGVKITVLWWTEIEEKLNL